MKRKLFVCSLALIFIGLVFSLPLFAQERQPGDYIIYRDYTWKNPTWFGFLNYGDGVWGAFLKTPELETNVEILFRSEQIDDEIVLTGQQIISMITEKDVFAVNYLMGLLPDLYKWSSEAKNTFNKLNSQKKDATRSNLLEPLVELKRSSLNFGGAFLLEFASEYAVFGLKKALKNENTVLFSAVKMGRISSGNDDDFFGFSANQKEQKANSFTINQNAKKISYTVDGIDFTIDEKWQVIADNIYMLDASAVLIIDTINLLEQGIEKNIIASLVQMFNLSSSSTWILPEHTKISGDKNKFIVENLIYDNETGNLHKDIKLVVLLDKNTKCTIASLTIEKSIWEKNKSYFDIF